MKIQRTNQTQYIKKKRGHEVGREYGWGSLGGVGGMEGRYDEYTLYMHEILKHLK